MAEDDPLRELIEAVADGTLDRGRLPGTHRDPTISQLLAELHILAGVSEVHRSQVAGDEPTTATSASATQAQPTPVTGDPISGPVDVPLAPGTQWGNFELVRKVGEGTFGEVFQARDLWLGHDVALKLLKTNVTDRARMLHEARMLVRVRHLNVVMVHGADVHGGRMGFWMDFVEGATLHDAIRREGPRSASEAFAWGQDLCRALAAVHGAGIVHRDVKAQNVMRRTSDGRLVLMDFGAGELLGTPRVGAAAGTPMYLAPELLHGAEASRSSDIYALGVLLFFLVSRKFPVQATSWDELLAAHARKERVRLEDLRPDMPAAFVDVIERALRPDPSQRYASAGEMLAAMRGGHDSGPLQVTPPISMPTARKASPPPIQQAAVRAGAVAGGLVVLALGLGIVACMFFDSLLSIDPAFAAGPADYLRVGSAALLPFVIFWLVSAAALAGLGGAMYLLRRPLAKLQKALRLPGIHSFKPLTLGAAALIAGMLAFLSLTVQFWPVLQAVESVRTNTVTAATISLLEPGGANTYHGLLSAFLSFLLAFVALQWFPRLEARDPSPVLRSLKWATLGLAALVVVVNVIPRRIIWDEFEAVQYENQRAVVLGNRGNELLLYVPESPARPWRRVNADAPGLERSGTREKVLAAWRER